MATQNKTNDKKERAPRKEYTADDKWTNFRIAGEKRTRRAVKALRALSGIARPSRYSWTEGDLSKMLGALATELKAVEARFQNPATRNKDDFTF